MRPRLFKRLLLCDISFLLISGLTIVLTQKTETSTVIPNMDVAKGNCSCGGFPTKSPAAGDAPVISQTPGLVVPLDEGGEETCRTLCFALAQATRAKGPAILCSRLKNAHEITLSVFHKVGTRGWKYSNITAPEPLCCADSKATICPSVLANVTTQVVTEPSTTTVVADATTKSQDVHVGSDNSTL